MELQKLQRDYDKLSKPKPVDYTCRSALGQLLCELDLCTSTLEVAALANELVSIEETLL